MKRLLAFLLAACLLSFSAPAWAANTSIWIDDSGVAHTITGVDSAFGSEVVVSNVTALQAAIAAIGSISATITVPRGTYTIASNLTIPANITLKVKQGAVFVIATTKTLTINGGLEAGLYQVFSWTGTGTVAFGNGAVAAVHPEWFGAKGDDSTDCTAALQKTADVCGQTKTLRLADGIYQVTATSGNYALTVNCSVKGNSPLTSIIKNVGTGSAVLLGPGTRYYMRWSGLAIVGNASSEDGLTTSTGGMVLGTETSYSNFFDLDIHNHGRHGLVHRLSWATRYLHCKFYSNGGLGVNIVAGDRNNLNAGTFIGCESRWNGGTGNNSADLTKGGVYVGRCSVVVWLGGAVEFNNAFGFIIGNPAVADDLDYPGAVILDGVHGEDNPRRDCTSTWGAQVYCQGRWSNVHIKSGWWNYYGDSAGDGGPTSWGFYITAASLGTHYPEYPIPVSKFTEENAYTLTANSTYFRKYVGSGILENSGVVRQNLLANSGFGVWSNSTLENVGSQVSVTDITAGVCTTTATEGIAVGKLVKFGAGGTTANKVYEVTAVTANTSFTLHDTSITDATDVTCYEVTPGCIAANDLGPEGWSKSYTATRPSLYREFNGTNTKGMYALKIVSNETAASHGLLQLLNKTDQQNSALGYEHLRGRTVTFGCWVKADAAGVAELQIYDRLFGPSTNTLTQSRTNLTTDWEWLEVRRTFPTAAIDRGKVLLVVNTTGHTVYFAQPMLAFGEGLGIGNYAPKPDEVINLEAPVTLTNFSGSTVATARTVNMEAESNGKIPKGIKAADCWVQVVENIITNGDCLRLTNGSGGAFVTKIYPQVANISNALNVKVSCDDYGDLYCNPAVTGGSTLTHTITVNSVQPR